MARWDDMAARGPVGPGELTGAYLVLLDADAVGEGVRALENGTGLSMASASDLADAAAGRHALDEADAIVFAELGCAVVQPAPDQVEGLRTASRSAPAILAMEPERVVHAIEQHPHSPVTLDYLRGYRDGIAHLVDGLGVGAAPAGAAAADGAPWPDESEATWGLQAVHAVESCLSGTGVRVAVLDTGFDAAPDYADRVVQMESFVDGESAQDEHGHGTHCIGSACGSLRTQVLPRYGVAHGAEIYAGKVLSNRGGGADRGILAGMDWALRTRCRVVSMSLGAPTEPEQAFSQVYEAVARRSLRAGTVIVAAAGNDSRRESGTVRPVSHPANCPSIMAVGAVDRNLAVAPFSNSGVNPNGGQVDVAAPGVDVHSSIPGASYDRWNGTSMATPHVAGVLALLAESDPDATGAELAARVTTTARRLPLASADVGAGLVQAPRR
ncbi:MAG: S8 family serine peptidase [Egibacteraceae bacterium]